MFHTQHTLNEKLDRLVLKLETGIHHVLPAADFCPSKVWG